MKAQQINKSDRHDAPGIAQMMRVGLHKMLLDVVRHGPICRRLMAAPGVGDVVALTHCATDDQPQRFVHSRAVGGLA